MSICELVTGPMRAGKTTYAHQRQAEGAIFVSFDTIMAGASGQFEAALPHFVEWATARPARDVVIDGWFSIHNPSPTSVRRLQAAIPQTVTVTGCYAPMPGLLERATELDATARTYQTREAILGVYHHLLRAYRDELRDVPFRFRTPEGVVPCFVFARQVREDALTCDLEAVLGFTRALARQGYDTRYSTIPLPFGQTIPGRDEDTLQLVAQLLAAIDVRGRTVLDAGCHHATIPFALEDAGALQVTAIDGTAPALETARRLRTLWGYQTRLVLAALDEFLPDARYDVITCCNTIQYVRDPAAVVAALFAAGQTVVWESEPRFQPFYDAHRDTHRQVYACESERWRPPSPRRDLYVYERIAA